MFGSMEKAAKSRPGQNVGVKKTEIGPIIVRRREAQGLYNYEKIIQACILRRKVRARASAGPSLVDFLTEAQAGELCNRFLN